MLGVIILLALVDSKLLQKDSVQLAKYEILKESAKILLVDHVMETNSVTSMRGVLVLIVQKNEITVRQDLFVNIILPILYRVVVSHIVLTHKFGMALPVLLL